MATPERTQAGIFTFGEHFSQLDTDGPWAECITAAASAKEPRGGPGLLGVGRGRGGHLKGCEADRRPPPAKLG